MNNNTLPKGLTDVLNSLPPPEAKHMEEVLIRLQLDPRLTSYDRGVWATFGLCCGPTGEAPISLRRMARDFGLNRRALTRSVEHLIETGWLGRKDTYAE